MLAYLDLIKPGETSLLTFIGVAAVLIAAEGKSSLSILVWVFLALIAGSAAVNGLTNYIDRDIDALMERTKHRALPSGRIYPPQKSLPFLLALLVIGLVIVWFLNPLCFLFGVIGALLAVVARKTAATHLLGTLSSTSPLLIGWVAATGSLNMSVLVLVILIVFWVPIHVWSLMLAYRKDFLQAGVKIFPLNNSSIAKRIIFILACLLVVTSIAIYFVASFTRFYLGAAIILGLIMLYGNLQLLRGGSEVAAWRVYKISAYPYLGIIFLAMILDRWLIRL